MSRRVLCAAALLLAICAALSCANTCCMRSSDSRVPAIPAAAPAAVSAAAPAGAVSGTAAAASAVSESAVPAIPAALSGTIAGGLAPATPPDNADLPVDRHATPETRALYLNLKKLSGRAILFGQQDALAYGVGRDHPDSGYCDTRDVCGSYPAVYGWDIGNITASANVDNVVFRKIRRLIQEGYARGGVITISWHEGNPATGGNVNDTRPCGARLLPGGDAHAELRHRLRLAAAFFKSLEDAAGRPIPVIFRPYHEHNGDWFWWGTKGCTEEEYRALFRFTVSFLRDSLNVHQLLYAISPDKSRMNPARLERDMLYGWPGDDCVDVFGLDNYWDVGNVANYDASVSRARQDTLFIASLRTLIDLAARKNKIPALTETGCNALTEVNWYTDRLLKPLQNHPDLRRIAWILVWRNANPRHFYTPYPGHPASEDFIRFRNDELILFEDEMPPMYRL